jgi:alpha-glucosidase
VILDLVMNHTSDQHAWFLESRSSRDNPKRDWYIWRDGKNSGPPNNWYSTFGGPAWEYDPATDQFYYHYFFKEQPDLNWRNPEVKEAMFSAVRFWLDMGVDGFRLDAIGTIYEDPDLPDHTSQKTQAELFLSARAAETPEEMLAVRNEFKQMYGFQHDLPGLHELLRELRLVINEYDDRMLVGETDEISYYGDGTNELNLVFNFPLMRTTKMSAGWIRANQKQRLEELPKMAWPCNTMCNHDTPRDKSRYSDGKHADEIARLSLALMLTLRGTPFLYNGEEIGMSDYPFTEVERMRDTLGIWFYHQASSLLGLSPEEASRIAAATGRDKCRTPNQWRNAANAGFCPEGVEPWLPVNPDYAAGINVADQEDDPASMLNFYRRMISLRKNIPALVFGSYIPLHEDDPDVLAYLRVTQGKACLVVLNYSENSSTLDFAGLEVDGREVIPAGAMVLYSSSARPERLDGLGQVELAPWEILIADLN